MPEEKLLSSELREKRLNAITNALDPDLEAILDKVAPVQEPDRFPLHAKLCERAGLPVGFQITLKEFETLILTGKLPVQKKSRKHRRK